MSNKVKVDLKEFKEALAQLELRSNDTHVVVSIEDRNLIVSAEDTSRNIMEVVLYSDSTMCAQFKHTERLMYMKKKS